MQSGKAPDFLLPLLGGEPMSLKDLLASGPVLLAFYKVTCPTCQLTFPFLERLHAGKHADAPRVVAISQDDAADTRKFNHKYGITLPTLLDPREDANGRYPASNAYGITNVPTLFLVETDGSISHTGSGFVKAELQMLGKRFGVEVITASDRVPVFQPG